MAHPIPGLTPTSDGRSHKRGHFPKIRRAARRAELSALLNAVMPFLEPWPVMTKAEQVNLAERLHAMNEANRT